MGAAAYQPIVRGVVSLKVLSSWRFVVACLIPCIYFIALWILSVKATSVLMRKGIRVGVLGAKTDDLKKVDAQTT